MVPAPLVGREVDEAVGVPVAVALLANIVALTLAHN